MAMDRKPEFFKGATLKVAIWAAVTSVFPRLRFAEAATKLSGLIPILKR